MMDWVSFLSTCFHIMIFSSAWTTVFWIKDKIVKSVSFFVVSSIYILIIQWYTPNMGAVLMDHDIVGQSVIKAWETNLFGFYTIYFVLTFVILVLYFGYLLLKKLKNKVL